VVYALWEKGLFQNDEIGQVFGLSYSAVSHIVKETRARIKQDPGMGRRAKNINSQFKM
jgi:predicted transcriptional regulator